MALRLASASMPPRVPPPHGIRPVGHRHHVAYLAAAAAESHPGLAVQDDAAADAGADEHGDQAAGAFARAHAMFTHSCYTHVVAQHHRHVVPLLQRAGDLDVLPARQVGEIHHHAPRAIDDAWCADADSCDALLLDLGRIQRVVHRLLDALNDGFGAFLGLCRALAGAQDVAVVVYNSGQNFRAAQIDTDCILRCHVCS